MSRNRELNVEMRALPLTMVSRPKHSKELHKSTLILPAGYTLDSIVTRKGVYTCRPDPDNDVRAPRKAKTDLVRSKVLSSYDDFHQDLVSAHTVQRYDQRTERANVASLGLASDPAWSDLVPSLDELDQDIVDMHNVPQLEAWTDMVKEPRPLQLKAAAVAVESLHSRFKGFILADPPGTGKTLVPLLAIRESYRRGDGPSVVVVPSSCTHQWVSEIDDWFPKGALPVLHLQEGYCPPNKLARYKLVVTSFAYVTSEYLKLQRFLKDLHAFDSGTNLIKPQRPDLTLLSNYMRPETAPALGNYLIIDEAHALKDVYGPTFAAVTELRESFRSCLLLTPTPLDNSWVDACALFSLLRGQPINSLHRMREAFSTTYSRRLPNYDAVPEGKYRTRMIQMMDAVTLRRPGTAKLPDLTHYTVEFTMPRSHVSASNRAFEGFAASIDGINGKGPGTKTDQHKLTSLIKAEHMAYHPLLVEIIGLERDSLVRTLAGEDFEDAELEGEDLEQWREWRYRIRKGENWRSPRVDTIVNLALDNLEDQPDDGILIIDESIYFLDILEVAFANSTSTVDIFRYDGRQTPDGRQKTLEEFKNVSGPRIMLASRHTGGQGLNLHKAANVLIRCGPWWRSSWEMQADGRIKRFGQEKAMTVYELRAVDVDVERYKADVRDLNRAINDGIMEPITRADDDELDGRRRIT